MKNIIQLLVLIGMVTFLCGCAGIDKTGDKNNVPPNPVTRTQPIIPPPMTSTCGNGITQETCNTLKTTPHLKRRPGQDISAGYDLVSLIAYNAPSLSRDFREENNLYIDAFFKETYNINLFGTGLSKKVKNLEIPPSIKSQPKGWNSFSPWNQAELNNKTIEKLGVLVTVGDEWIFPAVIYSSQSLSSLDTYEFTFVSSVSLDELSISIYDTGTKVYDSKWTDPPINKELSFTVSHDKFRDNGFKKIELKPIKLKATSTENEKSDKTYQFYHQKK